jgi:hypothetical protein
MATAPGSTCRFAAFHLSRSIANMILTSQPDDEQAQQSLDIGHGLYRNLLYGELYLAPIGDQPRKVRSASSKK